MKSPRLVFFLSILLELSLLKSSAQQGAPDHSMDGMNMPSAQMSSHEQMGGMAEMMDQMHPKNFIQGGQASCHLWHQRGAKLRLFANADVYERQLDVDVPRKRVRR